LKPVDVFAVNTLCDEIFSVEFAFFIVLTTGLIRRRCLAGVTTVVSIFIRFVVCNCFCVRNFIVELNNGVLPVGNCGIPTRRAVVKGVRKVEFESD
jgi:hypothetical protein